MILVLEIVTVEDVPAGERAELDEDLRLVVRPERRGVLLERIVHRRSTPIDLLNLVRFEVRVDRVGPAAAIVLEDPALGGIALRGRIIAAGVKAPFVDGPPVFVTKHESPGPDDFIRTDRDIRPMLGSCNDRGVIGDGRSAHNKLQQRYPWSLHSLGAGPLLL